MRVYHVTIYMTTTAERDRATEKQELEFRDTRLTRPAGLLRHMGRAHSSIQPDDVTNRATIGLRYGARTRESWPSKHGSLMRSGFQHL